MLFLWFSFGPDSSALLASVQSAKLFAADPEDRFVVLEERNRPIWPKERGELLKMGVQIGQRRGIRNLNGSKQAVVSVATAMLAHSDSSELIWKIDSDTMVFDRTWRERLGCFDLLGPKSVQPLVALGMSYIIRASAVLDIMDRLDAWDDYSASGWPEDAVISIEAQRAGASADLVPFDFNGGPASWCGWSYKPTATSASYLPYSVVSFGNRFRLTGSDSERRQKCGEVMMKLLQERRRVDIPLAENAFRQS